MRNQRLCSITVENFRSIAGRHTIPLDAPVVLIHGLNGAGKTSLLSAIEYGLTGELSSLDAIEKGYRKQLPHLGRDGSVFLQTEGVEIANPSRIAVSASGTRVRGMLDPRLARFFSTRCYLAQSTLSQLLTVYGTDEGGLGSPLSQFAADLLGLDRLDALQLGLRPARDVRNLRNLTPSYRSFEEKRDIATTMVETAERAMTEAQSRYEGVRERYASLLAALDLESSVSDDELRREPTDTALADLLQRERAIEAAARSAAKIAATQAPEPTAVAAAAEQAGIAAASWRETQGRDLATFLSDARRYLPDTPTSVTADVHSVLATLVSQLAAMAVERRAIITRIDTSAKRVAEIDDQLVRRRETAAAVERRIEIGAAQAPDLAVALAGLLPHIHDEDCPVCERNYAEVSERSLREVVAERVAAIQRGAVALANDTAERSKLLGEIAEFERERSSVAAAQPDSIERQNLDRTVILVEALASRATDLIPAAKAGADLLAEEVRTARLRADHAEGEAATMLMIEEIARLEAGFGIDDSGQATLEARFTALRGRARTESERLNEHARLLGDVRELKVAVAQYKAASDEAQARFAVASETRQRVNDAERAIRAIRDTAGKVELAAAEARASVVSEVFNDKLNKLWRDLFVRLAPDESFIPRFEVPPNATGRLRPVLRAASPTADLGGSPSIMLSSGNLNTAALTLFLALHLAVPPALPWLILDDPIQAMDDVHVSSFAALLRTLAKEKGRQIIIAVHNRALFDYLVLEMTPAFAGDELITVEFERSAAGELRVDPRRHPYRPRPRIVAAA